MAFVKAVKFQLPAKIAVCGPAGSGKTLTGLLLAMGILKATGGGRLAVLDSEVQRSRLYADRFDFDIDPDFGPPFTVEKYVRGIASAVEAGYKAILVDSLTHAWSGQGGVLEVAGGRFGGWKDATPLQQELINTVIGCPIHLIATMRSKPDYLVEEREDDRGRKKQVVKKIGLAPQQGKDIDYEFDWILDMEQDTHVGLVSKTRGCDELDQARIVKPGEDLGRRIAMFLSGEKAPEPKLATDEQLATLREFAANDKLTAAKRKGLAEKIASKLTEEDARVLIEKVEDYLAQKAAPTTPPETSPDPQGDLEREAARKAVAAKGITANAAALLGELLPFGCCMATCERITGKPHAEWTGADEVTLSDLLDSLRKLPPEGRKAHLDRLTGAADLDQ